MDLADDIRACTLCADRFAATQTGHRPRPVAWFRPSARLLIAGQAPGMRVHKSGVPFDDPSGARLRDWMGVDSATFYDQDRIAIVPMAFCFPGYGAKGSDLPPPSICAKIWRDRVVENLPNLRLTLLVGGYALRWHLGERAVTETVSNWRRHGPGIIPLPHPSWRNSGWIKKHPWFANDLLPHLRTRVAEVLR